MKLKNILIVVENVEKAIEFYRELFGLEVILDNDGSVIMTEGLVLQDKTIWEKFIEKDIISRNHASELYFEETDLDAFAAKLENYHRPIQYVNRLTEHSWGQKVIRFYDLDGNLIEVGTPMRMSGNKEAEAYLSGADDHAPDSTCEKSLPGQVKAYVDGSFDVKIGKYSFGCVMLTPEGEIIRESGNGDNPQSLALRNVSGEMLGAMFAVKWCEVNGYSAVEICYDYTGIEMWATGGWKAKNELTQKYAAFMKENGRKMRITYRKIAAHTGDKYNEEADRLAKDALVEGNGIPRITREVSSDS